MCAERILFILEGSGNERNIIARLNTIFKLEIKCDFICYGTQIYTLISNVYEQLIRDEFLDLPTLLRENLTRQVDKNKLKHNHSAIYFIFDFDPHANNFDLHKLLKFKEYFSDPIERALLLIN